ncbi:Cytochrome c biogenesis protein Ccs1 [Streptomyces tendae]
MSTTSKTTPGTDPGEQPKADGGDQDLGAAGSQLSTAPAEEAPSLPSLGVIGWARWFWRQLTSMRVALLLLLLLSLGAIPGSLIPQDGVDAMKVEEFRSDHDLLAPVYDKLGLFHVYSSVWFSAIYILLFVSLIGCIVPRTWQFVGQLRGRPPRAPRRLDRLPAYTTWRTAAEPEEVREAALKLLKKRRFRADAAGDAVAAEKGYLREVGNLAFHIALIVLLIAFAWGQLFKYEGNKLILEGDGFANTLTQYDDFKSGNLFDPDHDLSPFSFTLKDFHGTYEATGPNRGTPRIYEAKVTYSEGADGAEKSKTIKVNEPLHIDGSKVYLVSHGYAPILTVRDAKGDVVTDKQAVALLPLDGNVTSSGAVKIMDGYRNAEGKKEQLGFNAFFLPTYGGKGSGMHVHLPGTDQPDARALRLPRRPRRGLRHPAEHLPARQDQPGRVQGHRRQAVQAAAQGRRHHEPPERRRLGHLRRRPGMGRLPGHAAARQRLGAGRCRRRHLRPGRVPVHPAPPRLGAGRAGRRRRHRRGDGRPRPQRVREGPRGARRPRRGPVRPGARRAREPRHPRIARHPRRHCRRG